MQLFVPITKVEAQRRLVHGTIAAEIPDKAGEIFDYATSKPHFAAWSEAIAKASEGRSRGNLRAMHGKVAAGKLTALRFDDGARRIEAVAKVVDEEEWRKVEEGVYTGFSIGGRYAKRWPDAGDPALTRYTAEPSEVSLVDNPCIPGATFEVVRADGSRELRKFRGADAPGEHGIGKYGARHSKADLARVQRLHDTAVELGAACPGADTEPDGGDDEGDDATEGGGEKASRGALAKRLAAYDALEKAVAAIAPELAALRKRVDALEAQPLPPKGALRAIDKREETPAPKDPLSLIKQAQRNPIPFPGLLAKR